MPAKKRTAKKTPARVAKALEITIHELAETREKLAEADEQIKSGVTKTKKKAKRYEGWGPCFHVRNGVTSDEADAQEGAWLAEVTKDIPRGRGGELAEALLYEVTHCASVTLYSDQWVMVTANGSVTHDGKNLFETMIQGDHFPLALAETYRVWREKREELAKR